MERGNRLASGLRSRLNPHHPMITLRWILKMLADLAVFAVVNRAPFMALGLMGLMALGLVIVAVKVAAPFIYTLF